MLDLVSVQGLRLSGLRGTGILSTLRDVGATATRMTPDTLSGIVLLVHYPRGT